MNLKISEVYIDDPRVRDVEVEDSIEEKTRVEALAILKEAFEQAERKGSIESRQLTTKIAEVAKKIAGDLETRRPQVANLFPVEGEGNDYFVFQSLNAAVIAGIVTLKAGFYNRLFDVVLGTLLKDLGMMRVPAEILPSSEKLRPQEWEKVKQHPLHSLKLVGGVPGLSAYAKVAILHHHERLDGSGYPQGASGRNLNPLAQIAGMADAFSAMICQRPYRDKMLPREAVEYLMGSGGFEFELELVQTFCGILEI